MSTESKSKWCDDCGGIFPWLQYQAHQCDQSLKQKQAGRPMTKSIREQLEAIVGEWKVYESAESYRQRVIDALCEQASLKYVIQYEKEKFSEMLHDKPFDRATHTAIILAPQPIERGVSKQEIQEVLHKAISHGWGTDHLKILADRIEREGIKNE